MYDTELCNIYVNGDEYHYIMIHPYIRPNMELYFKHYHGKTHSIRNIYTSEGYEIDHRNRYMLLIIISLEQLHTSIIWY